MTTTKSFFHLSVFQTLDWSHIRVVILFSFFINALLLAVPLYTLQVYDRVFASRNDATLFYLTVSVILALILSHSIEVIKSHMLIRIASRIDTDISTTLMKKLLTITSPSSNQLLREVEKIKNFIGGAHGLNLFFDLPWAPIFMFIVFLIHPWLCTLMTLSMVLLFALTLATEFFTATHHKKANEHSLRTFAYADESVRHKGIIQALGMKKERLSLWLERHNSASYYLERASDYAVIFSTSAKFIKMGQGVLMTALGAYLTIHGDITIGGMIAANILASKATAPIEGIIAGWKNLTLAKEAVAKVSMALDTPLPPLSQTNFPLTKKVLSIENLVYTLEERTILHGVTFTLPSASFVGLLGSSGSGKTTLAKLLCGITLPSKGAVRLDGIDISLWESDVRGVHMGYLPQEITLLNGTIKENIARFRPVNDEDILEAARLAGAHEMILHLPLGYDTPLGVNGEGLSGGQRQRIALARAFFGLPSLIILDEPNAFLDAEGEKALIEGIVAMRSRGSTIVMITHKPSLLIKSDKLIVLANGSIAAFGDYVDIIRRIT